MRAVPSAVQAVSAVRVGETKETSQGFGSRAEARRGWCSTLAAACTIHTIRRRSSHDDVAHRHCTGSEPLESWQRVCPASQRPTWS